MTSFMEDVISTRLIGRLAYGEVLYVAPGVTLNSTGATTLAAEGAVQASGAWQGIYGTLTTTGGAGLSISGGNNNIDLGATGSIRAAGDGIYCGGGSNTLSIAGTVVSAGASGIFLGGNDNPGRNVLTISGSVTAAYDGIYVEGDHTRLTVTGEVTSRERDGVTLIGSNAVVINSGFVSGASRGIEIQGGNATIENSGTIWTTASYARAAIAVGGGAGQTNTIANSGTLDGGTGSAFFQVTDANAILTNTGIIFGNVSFAGGHDRYEGREGTQARGGVYGHSGNDTLLGGASDEVIDGGVDNDLIEGGLGDDTLFGGNGIDTLLFSGTAAAIVDLTLQASAANDWTSTAQNTGYGWDVISGFENVIGGSGNDHFTGDAGNNQLFGQGGADTLLGGSGQDQLVGGAGDDLLDGGSGADVLTGGLGDDIYVVEGLEDRIVEAAGEGVDEVQLTGTVFVSTAEIERIRVLSAAGAEVRGNATAEAITGGSGQDRLYGGAGDDRLDGGSGADVLTGGSGKDRLQGGAGNDRLLGGAHNDVLTGGAGKDVFVFDAKPDRKANFDKITDFNVKDDSIWLDNKIFKKLGKKGSEQKPAQLDKKFFTVGPKAKDKDDYLIYDKKKGVLLYDPDGSGSKAAVEVAQLSKNLKLTHKDFFVI